MRGIDASRTPRLAPVQPQRRGPAARLVRVLPVVVIALAAGWSAATTPYEAAGPAIRSDGSGYYAWTRAIVTGDLTFCGDPELATVRAISARDPGRGVCQNKYPPGTALLRLPVTAWLVDRSSPDPAPTVAEHVASRWLSALVLVATVALVADTCRRLGAGAVPSAVAVLGTTFGTGLFHYATYDGSFSHGTSALLVAFLCWLGVRASARGAPPPWLGTTAAVALATLTRNTNVVIVGSLLVGWLVWQRVPWRDLRALGRHVAPVLTGVLVGAGVQVAYNRYATGSWNLSSYGSEPFLFDRPRQHSVLLSYERGLLTWYPVLGVGLAVLLASRVGRRLAWWAALLVLPLVALYGFWFSWYLGGGFGHRGFVEVVPALAVLLAVGLHQLGLRHLVLAGGATALATVVTVSLMAGYWRGSIDFIGTRDEVWWDHVVGEESLLTP